MRFGKLQRRPSGFFEVAFHDRLAVCFSLIGSRAASAEADTALPFLPLRRRQTGQRHVRELRARQLAVRAVEEGRERVEALDVVFAGALVELQQAAVDEGEGDPPPDR